MQYDHRALRRATDSHALGALLALGLGLAAIVGVALDSCGASASDRHTFRPDRLSPRFYDSERAASRRCARDRHGARAWLTTPPRGFAEPASTGVVEHDGPAVLSGLHPCGDLAALFVPRYPSRRVSHRCLLTNGFGACGRARGAVWSREGCSPLSPPAESRRSYARRFLARCGASRPLDRQGWRSPLEDTGPRALARISPVASGLAPDLDRLSFDWWPVTRVPPVLESIDASNPRSLTAAVHGYLAWGDGAGPRRVAITETDLLWCARALAGSQTAAAREAGQSADGFALGAWCRLRAAANRHAMLTEVDLRSGRRPRFAGIGESLREYSTATSSRWREGGPACGPGGTYLASPMCDPRRLARRSGVRSLSWERIGSRFGDLRGALQAWSRGDHEARARAALDDRAWSIIATAIHTDQLARRVRLPNMECASNRYWSAPRVHVPAIRIEAP